MPSRTAHVILMDLLQDGRHWFHSAFWHKEHAKRFADKLNSAHQLSYTVVEVSPVKHGMTIGTGEILYKIPPMEEIGFKGNQGYINIF